MLSFRWFVHCFSSAKDTKTWSGSALLWAKIAQPPYLFASLESYSISKFPQRCTQNALFLLFDGASIIEYQYCDVLQIKLVTICNIAFWIGPPPHNLWSFLGGRPAGLSHCCMLLFMNNPTIFKPPQRYTQNARTLLFDGASIIEYQYCDVPQVHLVTDCASAFVIGLPPALGVSWAVNMSGCRIVPCFFS